ncbi:MAG TPA: hypothetical protein VLT62_13460 [Candidatus Methylomirabilis sp.]|nr:hypothetical protein [Candidatus Methylomirabilis sp.]
MAPQGRARIPTERERREARWQAAAAERAERKRLAEARRAWKRLGARGQFELACEIVETRAGELKGAYPGVLSLAAGHSRYRRPDAARASVWHEPAVTFLVQRKWSAKGKSRRSDAIPAYLFAYASVGGKRELCAVPTDVEDARHYRLRAQARSAIIVTPPEGRRGLRPADGTITCLVSLSPGSQTRYLMSCRHVFGLVASAPDDYPTDAAVSRENDGAPVGPVIARVDEIYGLLRAGTNDNFDVALARLAVDADDPAVLAVIEPFAPFDGQRYVDGHTEISELREYTILTPRGAKAAAYVRGWASAEQVPVDYGRLGTLRQRVLVIESSVRGGGTTAGDSGSPVVTKDRTQLVGMHFAGVNEISYMIPAYELVKRANYVGFARGVPFVIG